MQSDSIPNWKPNYPPCLNNMQNHSDVWITLNQFIRTVVLNHLLVRVFNLTGARLSKRTVNYNRYRPFWASHTQTPDASCDHFKRYIRLYLGVPYKLEHYMGKYSRKMIHRKLQLLVRYADNSLLIRLFYLHISIVYCFFYTKGL